MIHKSSPEKVGLLASQYLAVRSKTVKICKPLKAEDYVVQPIEDVSPPKWHLGHTTWFFENFILQVYKEGYEAFHKSYGFIFNSYYETAGERLIRTDRGNLTRPTTDEVMAYRDYVDLEMEALLNAPGHLPEKAVEIIVLGLHHEQQHQELLIYDIKYILGNNPLFPPYKELVTTNGKISLPVSASEKYLAVKEGVYPIGHDNESFCFDNELGKHSVLLHDFEILDRLITNEEYLEFINDGAYADFRYWLSEGWEWVKKNKVKAPLYWHMIDGEWHSYSLSGLKKISPLAPVTHISFFEADAFANWKGKRLPTEFEWETACRLFSPEIPQGANFQEQGIYEPVPREENNNQFYGDVWEWTSSAYRPYPNFKTEEGAIGEYNGKWMINQMVLRGGSCATPGNHIRATYRNFFHPHMRWHFSGIRLAQNI